MNFRVDLDTFRGPLDLLLYLVRKHEVDVLDIPIAPITAQFLEYLEILSTLDVDAVGDFVELASMLMEIKSRMVLPRAEDEEELLEDPREELVHRLLEYRKYRDAATLLEQQSRAWQLRYPRLASDLTPRPHDPADQPIHEVELWDLVSALGRVLRENEGAHPSSIVYDETPIQTYMLQIHHRLRASGRLAFSDTFRAGMHKSALIGAFLALLELVRHHSVAAEQVTLHGEIWILPGPRFGETLELEPVEGDAHGEADTAETQPPTPNTARRSRRRRRT
jgi:segregation and condensation protein A